MLFFKKKKPEPPKSPQMISVLMQDGSVEEYPETFYITDGLNCVICAGDCYHTHFDCESFKRERAIKSRQIKGMYVKDAERQGIFQCYNCKNLDDLFKE